MARTIDAALCRLSVCACITAYSKSDCSRALLLRAYSMSANKMSDLFLPASRLSREAELLSSISPVTCSPRSNRLWLYPRTVAVTISISSFEVLSGSVFSSFIHSRSASCGLCHHTTLNLFFLYRWMSPTLPSFIPKLKRFSNRTVYWASLLSSPKSAPLLWKAVILLLVSSPYRLPQCMREKHCMIVWVHKKIMGS